MTFTSFREYIEELDRLGDLKVIEGCDWNLEIGTVTELAAERWGPALLFDKIKDHEQGFRVLANPYASRQRTALALDLPIHQKSLDLIRDFRSKLKNFRNVEPAEISTSPVLENSFEGDNVDLSIFPAPKWHELDGGRFLGTGCVAITKDLEEGWTNLGIYRVQVHDRRTTGIYVTPSHHGAIMMRKYWQAGKNCPIAVAIGVEPRIYVSAAVNLPWGTSEYNFAGWLRNKPVEVIKGRHTGILIPAHSEIVIEGEVPPPDKESHQEGPFGEYTGYYTEDDTPQPVIKVKNIMFRNDPIIQGDPTLMPPYGQFGLPITYAPAVWNKLESTGIPGIKGVYTMTAAGGPQIIVISIRQYYAGHAKQVGMATSSSINTVCRFIIIVDEDIDPSDPNQVIWAVATRCEPAESMDIFKGCISTAVDPRIEPSMKDDRQVTNTRAIIYACKPYDWFDKFPQVNKASDDLRDRVRKKHSDLFGETLIQTPSEYSGELQTMETEKR